MRDGVTDRRRRRDVSTANEREKCNVSNLMKGLSEKWKNIISAISCVKVVTPEKYLSSD